MANGIIELRDDKGRWYVQETVEIGGCQYATTLTQSPNVIEAVADAVVLAGATTTILAADETRKNVMVISDPANAVTAARIGGAGTGAAAGNFLPPAGVWVRDTSGAIIVHNPNASSIVLSITVTKAG